MLLRRISVVAALGLTVACTTEHALSGPEVNPPIPTGVYDAAEAGPLEQILFFDGERYGLQRSGCARAEDCFENGTYRVAGGTLSLVDRDGRRSDLPFSVETAPSIDAARRLLGTSNALLPEQQGVGGPLLPGTEAGPSRSLATAALADRIRVGGQSMRAGGARLGDSEGCNLSAVGRLVAGRLREKHARWENTTWSLTCDNRLPLLGAFVQTPRRFSTARLTSLADECQPSTPGCDADFGLRT